ncbi:MAG: DUF423 domain-containing protein [Opitutales bacterium]
MSEKLNRTARVFAAISGALAVALGAFGAHALEDFLIERGTKGTWETAVLYHLTHAIALLAVALYPAVAVAKLGCWVLRLWIVGPLLFSGSVYLLAVGAPGWVAPITPLGGVAMLAGWVLLAVTLARAPFDSTSSR